MTRELGCGIAQVGFGQDVLQRPFIIATPQP